MKSINILFTSSGRRVELLRGFKEAFVKLGLNGRITTVDKDPLAPTLHFADVRYQVPSCKDDDYIPKIIKICRKEKIDLIFPLIDPDIPILAAHVKEISETGATPVVLPEEYVAKTTDKVETKRFFNSIGIRTSKWWLPEDFAPDETFPVYIKPRSGSASDNTHKIRDYEELEFWVKRVPNPIIEEFLPGPEVTNDVVCDMDGDVLAVVSRERIETRGGEVTKGKTIRDDRIIDSCATIARALKTIGPITIQYMMKDGEPFFTEINARFGGGFPFGLAAKADSIAWMLARYCGLDVHIPPLGTYEEGLYMSRFDDSKVLTEADIDAVKSHRP